MSPSKWNQRESSGCRWVCSCWAEAFKQCPEALEQPALPHPLFHFSTGPSGRRLVDKWLFLREWVPWPRQKGDRSVSIRPPSFQAYYTVISTSSLLLGIASPAFLAAGHRKRGRGSPTMLLYCDLSPLPLAAEGHSPVTFVCFSESSGNLYPFGDMMTSAEVCSHTESERQRLFIVVML